MNEVLQKHPNIYAEDEAEDFGREKNKQAEYVYFVGCVGLYREDEITEATLDFLDHFKVDYTLIDDVIRCLYELRHSGAAGGDFGYLSYWS